MSEDGDVKMPAMRAVCQRVVRAQVTVAGETVGAIGRGLVVLLGVARRDEVADAERMAGKVARLRVFEDEHGKFAQSVLDVGGAALVVSQFTLIAATSKGNRPSFTDAAPPDAIWRVNSNSGISAKSADDDSFKLRAADSAARARACKGFRPAGEKPSKAISAMLARYRAK